MLTTASRLLEGDLAAIAAFNVITLEYAEGIVLGAERAGLPVLLSVSHNAVRFHRALEPIAAGCLALASAAGVQVGLHLDHCEDARLVEHAADLGFGSAMFDASTLPYEQNLAETAAVAARGHELGIWVEAELGEIGGKDGAHAPGVRTDPEEAASFVAATGVDALAVAVGTSHAMTHRTAQPDLGLISRLAHAVPVPLVLHGSSGVADDGLRAAVGAGIRKVNVGTQLSVAYTEGFTAGLGQGPDPRKGLVTAREAIAASVEHLLRTISEPVHSLT